MKNNKKYKLSGLIILFGMLALCFFPNVNAVNLNDNFENTIFTTDRISNHNLLTENSTNSNGFVYKYSQDYGNLPNGLEQTRSTYEIVNTKVDLSNENTFETHTLYYNGTINFDSLDDYDYFLYDDSAGSVSIETDYVYTGSEYHKGCLKILDSSSSYSNTVNFPFTNQTNGNIEFWLSREFTNTFFVRLYGKNGISNTESIVIRFQNNDIQYKNSLGSYINIATHNGVMSHFRIDFDVSTSLFDLYYNGVKYSDLEFYETSDYVDTLNMATGVSEMVCLAYIDAIDFSWNYLTEYNGMYTFDNYEISYPFGYQQDYDNSIYIKDSYQNHKNVMKINYTYTDGRSYCTFNFDSENSVLDMEFWICIDGLCRFGVYDNNYDTLAYIQLHSYLNDYEWSRVRIKLDSSYQNYSLWVNDVLNLNNISFTTESTNGYKRMLLGGLYSNLYGLTYLDSFSYNCYDNYYNGTYNELNDFDTVYEGGNTSISLVNYMNHSDCIKFYDTDVSENCRLIDDLDNGIIKGSLQFYVNKDVLNAYHYFRIFLSDINYGAYAIAPSFYMYSNALYDWKDGVIYSGINNNQWYLLRYDFDCISHNYDLYIDNDFKLTHSFSYDVNIVDKIYLETRSTGYLSTYYIDGLSLISYDDNDYTKEYKGNLSFNSTYDDGSITYDGIGYSIIDYANHNNVMTIDGSNDPDIINYYFSGTNYLGFYTYIRSVASSPNFRMYDGATFIDSLNSLAILQSIQTWDYFEIFFDFSTHSYMLYENKVFIENVSISSSITNFDSFVIYMYDGFVLPVYIDALSISFNGFNSTYLNDYYFSNIIHTQVNYTSYEIGTIDMYNETWSSYIPYRNRETTIDSNDSIIYNVVYTLYDCLASDTLGNNYYYVNTSFTKNTTTINIGFKDIDNLVNLVYNSTPSDVFEIITHCYCGTNNEFPDYYDYHIYYRLIKNDVIIYNFTHSVITDLGLDGIRINYHPVATFEGYTESININVISELRLLSIYNQETFTSFLELYTLDDIINIVLIIPEVIPENYWIYTKATLQQSTPSLIQTERFNFSYPLIEITYESVYYPYEVFSFINEAITGYWGIFDGIRIGINFIIKFFADFFVNLLIVPIQFFLYLLTMVWDTLIIGLIVSGVFVLVWNIIIYYLVVGVLNLVNVLITFVIDLLLPALQWFWDVCVPVIMDILVEVWSYVLALFLYLLSFGQADYLELQQVISDFGHMIANYLLEMIDVIITYLPSIILYSFAYIILIGFVYVKYIYCKARGYKNRSENLYESYLTYVTPIIQIKNILSGLMDTIPVA